MKSFAIDLDDLHCTVHFLMINLKTHKTQVKKAITDLKHQKYPTTDDTVNCIDSIFQDCVNNPGFTFQLSDTDVVIALREEYLIDSDEYLIGIIAHEISHAITFLFESLQIGENDEMRSIELGNLVEGFLKKSKFLKRKTK